jgi:hypothetical protein
VIILKTPPFLRLHPNTNTIERATDVEGDKRAGVACTHDEAVGMVAFSELSLPQIIPAFDRLEINWALSFKKKLAFFSVSNANNAAVNS